MDSRADAIAKAKHYLSQPLVVFDTETTGLGDDAEIVEIAVIDSNGEILMDELVRPVNPVPPGARAVHGITDATLVNAPTFDALLPTITDLFHGKVVTAYNLDFDLRLLKQSASQRGQEEHLREAWTEWTLEACIMELYAEFYGSWNHYHHSYDWHSLTAAITGCKVAVEGPLHRASTDAKGALAVLKHIAAHERPHEER